MKHPITQYARLGLVHHMLYPDCAEHPAAHVATLTALAARADIETFDCCLPYDSGARAALIPNLRACGKADITFATHFFPLRKLSFCEIDVPEMARILRCLVEVGFLSPERRGNLVIEMTPWPGKTVEETIADAFDRLNQAWEQATPS